MNATIKSVVQSDNIYMSDEYMQMDFIDPAYDDGPLSLEELEDELEALGLTYWNYPINEIDHIVEEKIPVVMVRFETGEEGIYEYRWCEVESDDN